MYELGKTASHSAKKMKANEKDEMVFDSKREGPSKPQMLASHRPNIEMNMPGNYVDSQPGSDMSMDAD